VPGQGRRCIYKCGEWEVDATRRELLYNGGPALIGGRAFEILEVLAQSAGELVTKNDLISRIWPGAVVEENTLQVHISAIRKALGADRHMLRTASGRGYRLLGNWTIQNNISGSGDRSDSQSSPERPFVSNLPLAEDLIGRASAVLQLEELLSTYRAVTLTGTGGIGKTRLALEVARSLLPKFEDACCIVEFGSVSDPKLVSSSVAGVLGLQLGGNEISPVSVARSIGGRKLLLLLDNCEHVIDDAAALAHAIMRICPRASLLVTSREILRIDGEHVYRVPPLDVPSHDRDDIENGLQHSALQLFIARTRSLQMDFVVDRQNIAAVTAICRRLDGIPLAIEFAAARAATLGILEVSLRLDDRFKLLTGGHRTALPRHQTLRATLDWSYNLLPDAEQRLLNHLAVFAGGFTLEAAIALITDDSYRASAVADGITNLVAKSLVVLDGSASPARWRLLETVRAYALEALEESGKGQRAARRHAEFFRDLFVSGPASEFRPTLIAFYRREIDNVSAALDWAFSPVGDTAVGVVLTAAYVPTWLNMSLMTECRDRAQRALDNLQPEANLSTNLRIQLLTALGVVLVYTTGMVESTLVGFATALEVAERADDMNSQLRALWALWSFSFYKGANQVARSYAERFSRVARRTEEVADILIGNRLFGTTMHYAGDQVVARHHLERVIDLYTAPVDQRHTAWFHHDQRLVARAMLARTVCLQGFADQARHNAQVTLEAALTADHKLGACYALGEAVCPIALMTGDYATAERSIAMLGDLATAYSFTFWTRLANWMEGELLIKGGHVSKGVVLLRSAFDAFRQAGQMLHCSGFVGALAEALGGVGHFAEGLSTIEEALERADRDGVRWHVAELLRVKGELILQESAGEALSVAADCFLDALTLARRQGALFWELRIALSLARVRIRQEQPAEARQALTSVYDRVTEGFGTADMCSARAIIDGLAIGIP